MVPILWQSCHFMPRLSIILELPTQTWRPATSALMPCPAISCTPDIGHPSVASLGNAALRASPIGCVEKCSTCAARCSSSCPLKSSGWTASTANTPLVRVPVLSKTTVPILESVSIYVLPLISMPLREAPPRPPKNVSGTLMTRAQGHDTTRKMRARWSHPAKSAAKPPAENRGGTMASSTAAMTTTGVYTLANLVMNDSLRDLLLSALSTRLRILETVLSPKLLVVFTRSTPDRLMQPDITSSPSVMSRGMLSPVRAMVLREELPSMTVPSSGTFSPGLMTITSPGLTSSGATFSIFPSLSTSAESGLISMRWEMLSRLLPSA